ncbi:MAG: GTPase [Candidatus Nanohaloarchaea archaeon]|nr:GTPase [Candidatus Nanohaloarchaea archaeon]
MPEKWRHLTELSYVGEKTARKLYENGFITKKDVVTASEDVLTYLLGPAGARIHNNNSKSDLEGESAISRAIDGLKNAVSKFKSIFSAGNHKIGIYGSTNVGKTTLGNRIAMDWKGRTIGRVSDIPHETREIQRQDNLTVQSGESELDLDLIDTPGFVSSPQTDEMEAKGLSKKESEKRENEVKEGVQKAIKVMEDIDIAVAVFDASRSLEEQNPVSLFSSLEARNIPCLVVANKVDKEDADMSEIEEKYPESNVVAISAKHGDNMSEFYSEMAKMAERL